MLRRDAGHRRRADRLTLGLAGRRRPPRQRDRRRDRADDAAAGGGASRRRGVVETAEQALEAAGRATQDTVAVAIEGYDATPRGETVLFNMLTGFVGGFALMRLSTWGIRGGWWPFGNVSVGAATSTTSCRGS